MDTTSTPDTDCNRVSHWPAFHFITSRCTQPEGHMTPCWLTAPEVMKHKHRAPVPTDTDPFGIRPRGGKHRARPAYVGAASGPNRVDAELRRRLALAMDRPLDADVFGGVQ